MNWYKKAQQHDFSFLKDIPVQSIPSLEEREDARPYFKKDTKSLRDIVEYQAHNLSELISILERFKFPYKKINDVIFVETEDGNYIVDDMMDLKKPIDWIWGIWDVDPYIEWPNFNENFWDSPQIVYHATSDENLDTIMKRGLMVRDRSRGMGNTQTGMAIFTSENPDDIDAYGERIIEINTSLMKQDGYMPEVSRESPIIEAEKREALARMIGLDDFFVEIEAGISPSTIIFYDNIPTKYLRIYK